MQKLNISSNRDFCIIINLIQCFLFHYFSIIYIRIIPRQVKTIFLKDGNNMFIEGEVNVLWKR